VAVQVVAFVATHALFVHPLDFGWVRYSRYLYPGRRVVLRVNDVHALGGGGWSGPKWLRSPSLGAKLK